MKEGRVLRRTLAVLAIAALTGLADPAFADPPPKAKDRGGLIQRIGEMVLRGKVTPAERKAAAERIKAALARLAPSVSAPGPATAAAAPAAAAQTAAPLAAAATYTTPDYFGSAPNWANSPLPASDAVVTITDGGGAGSGAAATATVGLGGVVTGLTLTAGGSGYSAPVVSITGSGNGAAASATADPNTGAITALTLLSGGSGYYLANPNGTLAGAIRKFVDTLPGLGPANANNLGQYLPVAVPDTTSYPGSDYYEIELREYTEKMHSDLLPTTLRGYVQVRNNVDVAPIHYLGPVIVAQKDRPVRIKFSNKLSPGAGGDLFLPVDTTVMGAGMGPVMGEKYTQNRATLHLHGGRTPWISDGTPHQWTTPAGESTSYPQGVSVYDVPDMDGGVEPAGTLTFYYTNQQSARLMFYHDHAYGITRLNVYAGEAAGYLVEDPAEQDLAARGIIPTEQIPLIIQDRTFLPGASQPQASQLTAQDPTWPWPLDPNLSNLWFPHVYMPNQNPYDMMGANAKGRWDYGPWFWPPFTGLVNGPVPNPYYDPTNAPWEPPEIPGTPNPSIVPEAFMDTPIVNGTAYPILKVGQKAYRFRILNACNDRYLNLQLYFAKSSAAMWNPDGSLADANAGEVNMVPAVPNSGLPATWPTDGREGGVPDPAVAGPSIIQIGNEGGLLPAPAVLPNTPVGYEYDRRSVTVLNVSNKTLFLGPAERADVIVDFSGVPDGSKLILYNDAPAPVPAFDPRVDYYTGHPDLTDVGGAPPTEPGYGPNTRTIMQIQIDATLNGGVAPSSFDLAALQNTATGLPAAYVASQPTPLVPQAPYGTAYGQTYPLPASAAVVAITDSAGGTGSGATATATVSTAGVVTGLTLTNGGSGYSAPVVAITGDGSGATATATATGGMVTGLTLNTGGSGYFGYTATGYARIASTSMTFTPAEAGARTITKDLEPKAIIEDFDVEYGRMNALLGVEIAHTNNTNQTSIIQHYLDPPTEILLNMDAATPMGAAGDGSQIWKITHNGVDTHAIHFHMFDVQLINRIGWDGMIKPPDANEVGWKETIRMNPLEDIVVALRPIIPVLPPTIKLPNSVRLLDPTMPAGSTMGFTNIDPAGNPITVTNQEVNYGWEYVWHCHLLGHEENDMMRAVAVAVAPDAPSTPVATVLAAPLGVRLNWNDNSPNATGFTIQRATDAAFTTNRVSIPAAKALGVPQTFTDNTVAAGLTYYYRVIADNLVGSTVPGYPQATASSPPSGSVSVAMPFVPATPSNLVATGLTMPLRVRLTWLDNANNETGFIVQRATAPTGPWTNITTTVPAAAGTGSTVTYTDTAATNTTYYYQVLARNANGNSPPSNKVTVGPPAAASNVAARQPGTGTIVFLNPVVVTWTDNAPNAPVPPNFNAETSFLVQRSTTGTGGWTTIMTVGAAAGSGTTVTFNDRTASRLTTYYYRIIASNMFGNSAASPVSSAIRTR